MGNSKLSALAACMFLVFSTNAQTGSVPCPALPANHISNFTSVMPSAQSDTLRIPASHAFQVLAQEGEPYTNAADGNMKILFDFTGYVPINGSSTEGYLSINHEVGQWPLSGVSMLTLFYNWGSQLWQVTHNAPVDFSSVGGTSSNCSGTVTPWNTIVTSEEAIPVVDAKGDGYQDIGWMVEIEPATHSVKDQNNDGSPDKLWRLGRMKHENVVVAKDSITLYEGNDDDPGYLFKFIADVPGKLANGNLYVLKLNGSPDTATTGQWIQVPNNTPAECNNVRAFAASVDATNFSWIEDVEIGPKDGKIYFTTKTVSRVYRFTDNGNTIGNFDIFIGNAGAMYNINYGTGIAAEQWRDGNDNLAFDDEGNLYVLQDGGRSHIWMVRPCHTDSVPQVELFAVTPIECEPTGMTFSPDYRFMFLSIQHPAASNSTVAKDVIGNGVVFNRSTAMVIARKEYLGSALPLPLSFTGFTASRNEQNKALLEWQFAADEAVAKFEVQRMSSGIGFEAIKQITTQTNAGNIGSHRYIDENPVAGKNYYRIKAIQRDGKEVFTGIKIVDIPATDKLQLVHSFPNPASVYFKMVIANPGQASADVHVLNAANVPVMQQRHELQKGMNTLSLNTEHLPQGIYIVVVSVGEKKLQTRMLKQ